MHFLSPPSSAGLGPVQSYLSYVPLAARLRPKYVPRVRERVQIIGRSRVFLVVGVDEEQQAADLFPLHFAIHIEEAVPFSHLEPYRENLPLYQAELPNIERHDTRNHLHHRTLPRLAILATL